MTVLTGETGAGKSILVDALALALGDRAERSLIRPGSDQAEVTAVFDLTALPGVRAWLEAHSLLEGEECFLRRVLNRNGRSRAFINGRPVPRQQLAELGEQLVEIHGQHEHQRLLRPAVQRQLLDAWAGHGSLLETVAAHHTRWREAARELESLQERVREREQRLDYLEFQLEELRRAADDARELPQLEGEQRRLANANELLQECARLQEMLAEGEPDAQTLLSRAQQEIEGLAQRLAPELAPAAELLESARIQAEEAAALVREFATGLEPDPEALDALDRRLARVHDAARKHRIPPEQLPDLLQEMETELEELQGLETALGQGRQAVEHHWQAYREACRELTASRRKAAGSLAAEITERMQGLAMAGGRFEVRLQPLPEGQAAASGLERVEFLVATNPGQEPAPLSSVASGGELSRLSLAIQVATTSLSEVPTLIFDEVDVGIGGAVAETVGRSLRELGASRQVLCVTHLAQVAAQADHHLQVTKSRHKGAVRTRITPLSREERIREIARMVGGRRITRQTLAHAEELIQAAG